MITAGDWFVLHNRIKKTLHVEPVGDRLVKATLLDVASEKTETTTLTHAEDIRPLSAPELASIADAESRAPKPSASR